MLAQEFQDLTGQTVSKVLAMASDLEKTLVAILVEVAPVETKQVESKGLDGPVVNYAGRTDVVANQSEVDDLLSSLGF
jgi:chemotaxis protein CheZ